MVFLMLLGAVNVSSAVEYPVLTDFVTDNAGMISPEYEVQIARLSKEIEQNTTVEIAVLTVNSLEGDSMENYAVKTFEKTGIGKKDKDNGLLILLSREERAYRVEVGYGLEGLIPDAHKIDIGIGIMEPNFKQGEFGKGIYEAILAINGLIQGQPEVLSKYKAKYAQPVSEVSIFWSWLPFILLFVVFPLIFGRRRGSLWFPLLLMGPRMRGGFSGGAGGFGGFGGGFSGGGGFGGRW